MTDPPRAPQRWQRISAAAGISLLPLIPMFFPSILARAGLANLAQNAKDSWDKRPQNLGPPRSRQAGYLPPVPDVDSVLLPTS
jgi:hypothetical protein